MAEALLAARLRAHGTAARVHSAGELPGGVHASPGSVRAMARRGLDLGGHVSRTVTPGLLDAADLVIGMGRRHVRHAVVLLPGCFERTFTLKELARRASSVGARQPDETMSAWLARIHHGREIRDLLGEDFRDDVADPIGSPDRVYEATALELETLLDQVVSLAFVAERRESA